MKILNEKQRLIFIAATFGKYLEHYTSKNDNRLDDHTMRLIMESVVGELEIQYQQPELTEKECDDIAAYLEIINKQQFELDEDVAEKLK